MKAKQKKPVFEILPVQPARDAVRGLEKGGRIVGVTKGQFSLIDLIKAVLEVTGPASLALSTWTAGIRDAENVGFLVERGQLTSLKLLTDRSFAQRQPQYARRVTEIFGKGAIRCTYTHAKFALIQNAEWNVCIRSSMNLNRNPRLEQFDIDDDPEIYAFFEEIILQMEQDSPEGAFSDLLGVENAFGKALGGGLVEPPSTEARLKSLLPW